MLSADWFRFNYWPKLPSTVRSAQNNQIHKTNVRNFGNLSGERKVQSVGTPDSGRFHFRKLTQSLRPWISLEYLRSWGNNINNRRRRKQPETHHSQCCKLLVCKKIKLITLISEKRLQMSPFKQCRPSFSKEFNASNQ